MSLGARSTGLAERAEQFRQNGLVECNLDDLAKRDLLANVDGSAKTALGDWVFEYSWSPDGRSLVVQADYPAGPLRILDADGQDSRLLTHGLDLEPAWSPDGRTIAFARVRAGSEPPKDGPWDLYTVPARGGTPTLIARTASWPGLAAGFEAPGASPGLAGRVLDHRRQARRNGRASHRQRRAVARRLVAERSRPPRRAICGRANGAHTESAPLEAYEPSRGLARCVGSRRPRTDLSGRSRRLRSPRPSPHTAQQEPAAHPPDRRLLTGRSASHPSAAVRRITLVGARQKRPTGCGSDDANARGGTFVHLKQMLQRLSIAIDRSGTSLVQIRAAERSPRGTSQGAEGRKIGSLRWRTALFPSRCSPAPASCRRAATTPTR
jgi:hypothetical protein